MTAREPPSDPVEHELEAHEAHASATASALMLFLWGAVSIFIVPRPFHALDITNTIVGAAAFGWFLATRRRPRTLVAYLFTAATIIEALTVLPWVTSVWCALGRPYEALNVPQVAMLGVALIVPRSLVVGVSVVLAFLAQALLVTVYAHHVGLHARVPVGEPTISLCWTVPALGLLLLRERRRSLARRHVRLRAESDTLARLGPLFIDVRRELQAELALGRAALLHDMSPTVPPTLVRSLDRLDGVAARLGMLGEVPPDGDAGDGAPTREAADGACVTDLEHRFLVGDERLGAIIFALLATLVAAAWAPIGYRQVGNGTGDALVACAVAGVLALALLTATDGHKLHHARGIIVALYVVMIVAASLNQRNFLHITRPFTPFIGHKLAMVMLGLAAATWPGLARALILATFGEVLALYHWLGFDAHRDRLSIVEPWVTLVFAAVGIAALQLRDQRRLSSLALLRAEARLSALHRRALLLLSLRDQLNTPLQTLALSVARLEHEKPADDFAAAHAAITSLVALSRRLADLDIPPESQVAMLDSETLGARG